MIKWFLYLFMSPLLTPAERQTLKDYYREQRSSFCERHLIADMPPELEELERQLDEEERSGRQEIDNIQWQKSDRD